MAKILAVDDEPLILDSYKKLLMPVGYQYEGVTSCAAARARLAASVPDLLILDLRLRDGDGVDLCRALRTAPATQSLPIIVVSALADYDDRIDALNSGADDFLCKPFHKDEFRARIHAVLRRSAGAIPDHPAPQSLHFDDAAQEASYRGHVLALTGKQYRLLKELARPTGKYTPKDRLTEIIWQNTRISPKTLETHLSNLRKRIEPFGLSLQNKFGVGYRVVSAEREALDPR